MERYLAHLRRGFILLANLKLFVSVVLLTIHAYLESQMEAERDLNRKGKLKKQLDLVYLIMFNVGVNHRSLKTAAFYIYGFYFFVMHFFTLSNFVLFKHLVKLDSNPFYQFMSNSKETCLKTEIDACLAQLISSNSNYIFNSMDDRSFEGSLSPRMASNTSLHQRYSLYLGALGLRDECRYSRQFDQVEQQNAYLRFLLITQQHYHLRPAHRTREWREKLMQLGTNLQTVLQFVFGIVGGLLIFSMQRLAYLELQKDSSLPEHLRHFSLADRLTCIELHLLTSLIVEWFVFPFVVTIINIYDQLKYLSLLTAKFKTYFRKLQYRLLWKPHQYNACGKEDCTSCDQESLELYLEWMLFIRLLRRNLDWLNFSLSQYAICALCLSYFLLNIIRSLSGSFEEVRLGSMAIVLAFILINLFMCLYAAFHAKCVRLAKRAWSVVASLQQLDDEEDERIVDARERRHKQQVKSIRSALHHWQAHPELASEHTLLLWRRINTDSNTLINWFSCRLFNSLVANYSNILRLNFWLISLVILDLNSRSFR